MLDIINTLAPFIEDCHRRISVREFAKIKKISPPTASKLLSNLNKEGLLDKEESMQRHFYSASRNEAFIDIARIYWRGKLKEVLDHIEKETVLPVVILYGSLSKGENSAKSDVDLAVFTPTTKRMSLDKFEETIKRPIHLFVFKRPEDIRNKDLANNMLNGMVLRGRVRYGLGDMSKGKHSEA